MKGRAGAIFVVVVTALVSVAMVSTAVDLVRSGDVVQVGVGVGVLLLVAVGVVLVVAEVRLGADSERLGRRLGQEGGLPLDPPGVTRPPSGRMPKADAAAQFERRRAEVEQSPEDWRAWWRLAAAYGDAKDTARGRKAMRKAITLERAERSDQGSVSRRTALLGALGGAGAVGLATLGLRRSPRPRVVEGTTRTVDSYGELPLQIGEWWVPPAVDEPRGLLPTVVLVHGGFWQPGFDRSLEDAVAADLAGRGYLVWNVDYRSGSEPWPATLLDVAAAYDHLAVGTHAALVDPARIAVVGHSAGGQLALWLAGRRQLPAGAPGGAGDSEETFAPAPALAVGQAPVAALRDAAAAQLGGGAAQDLVDGEPGEVPDRYDVADPIALLPTGVRTVCVHGERDDLVPPAQSRSYVEAAVGAGDDAQLAPVPGGHFEHLDPASPACQALRDALASM